MDEKSYTVFKSMQINFKTENSRMNSPDSIILLLLLIITADVIYGDGASNYKTNDNHVIYNDGQLVVLNDRAIDAETLGTWNEDIDLNKFIPPISDSEIMCLMHVDKYCSKPMADIKGLLIKALKDDCENCTIKEKESVGKIVSSMWAHNSQLWKLFLKRFDSTNSLIRIIKPN